jgi:UDP-N-acetylmuramoylalanine--D-glutamate ligase
MITGTNGKSTVTTLVGDILSQAGFQTLVGGNLGRPVCDMAAQSGEADWLVAEVSSFQTDTMARLRPRVGVVLNITPDHLDRYPGFAAYAESKMSLLRNQAGEDVAVLCAEDPEVWSRRGLAPARVWGYGARGPQRPGGWLEGGELVLDTGQETLRLPLPAGHLAIGFNRLNCLAACLAALACGAKAPAMQAALAAYRVLGHRLALVGQKGGVSFFDDSKGTNLGAVAAALGALDMPVVLLLGGRDKDGRFADLGPLLKQKVVRVICFGEAGPSIQTQLAGLASCEVVADLAAAVKAAAQAAAPGQAVLLSPGCASFDAYQGYAQRGEHFQTLVREVLHG